MLHKKLWIYLLLFPIIAAGQNAQKNNYNLLWEITGNGLETPSFLFGSMHVVDSRAFEFSDSVLLALERCDAFANEIFMDSILYASIDSVGQVSEVINDFFYTTQQLGYTSEFKSDNYPTFLDAYLMNIAKKQGKTLYGLELLKDYFQNLMRSNFIRPERIPLNIDSLYENMMLTYQIGDLEKIQKNMKSWGYETDSFFIERNRAMANSIQRISKTKSIFSVVGAGHLIGKSSVIELLRAKGYYVRPVSATFTGKAQTYQPKTQKQTWHKTINKKIGFGFEMPLKPYHENLQKFGTPANRYLSIDLGGGINYLFHHALQFDPKVEQLYYHSKTYSISLDDTILISLDTIVHQGVRGIETVWKTKFPVFFKKRVFYKDNQVYELEISTVKENLLDSEDVKRFFNAFEFRNDKLYNQYPRNLLVREGGFSVYMAGESSHIKETPKYTDFYYQTTMGTKNSYYHASKDRFQYVSYQDLNNPTQHFSDTSLLNDQIPNLDFWHDNVKISRKQLNLEGYTGKEVAYEYLNRKTTIQTYLRGARIYTLINTQALNEIDNQFLNSFCFEQFESNNFTLHRQDTTFSINVPVSMEKVSPLSKTVNGDKKAIFFKQYESHEPNTGIRYSVDVKKYSPYAKFANEKTILSSLVTKLIIKKDSLWLEKDIIKNGIKGKELIFTNFGQKIVHRVQFFLSGDTYYQVTALVPKEMIYTVRLNSFFDSFTFYQTNESKTVDLFTDKKELLLKNLASSDSTEQAIAFHALGFYDFTIDDKTLIYAALDKTYPNDSLQSGTTIKLLNILQNIKDSTAVSHLKNWYLVSDNQTIRLKIASILAEIGTDEALSTFFKVFKKSTPFSVKDTKQGSLFIPFEETKYGNTFSPFYQSSYKNFITYFDDFLAIAKEPDLLTIFLDLASQALEEKVLNPNFFASYLDKIIALSDSLLEKEIKHNKQIDTEVERTVGWEVLEENEILFNNFFNEKTEQLLLLEQLFTFYYYLNTDSRITLQAQKYAMADSLIYRMPAINYFLEKNQKIKKSHLTPLLNSQHYLEVLRLFHRHSQLKKISKKYRKHEKIALALFTSEVAGNNSSYETYTVTSAKIVKDSIIDFKNKAVRVYLIKAKATLNFNFNENSTPREVQGILGPFPIKKNDLFDFSKGVLFSQSFTRLDSSTKTLESLIREAKNYSRILVWD